MFLVVFALFFSNKTHCVGSMGGFVKFAKIVKKPLKSDKKLLQNISTVIVI